MALAAVFTENKGKKVAKLSYHIFFFFFGYCFGFYFWLNKSLNIQPHVFKTCMWDM